MTGISSSCGACKFLRRKCNSDCVFSPYFRYDLAAQHFGAIHRVFGASNASRLLLHLPEQCRSEAAIAMSFEALARMREPVYGCVAYIYALQQQVAELQEEIQNLSNIVANRPINIQSNMLTNGVEMHEEYGIRPQEQWDGVSINVDENWILEDDVNIMNMSRPGFWQEENLQGGSELGLPFEIPFDGMINEDIFGYLPLLLPYEANQDRPRIEQHC